MKLPISNNRGSALLIVLMLMGMLSIVGVMAVDRSNTDVDLSYNQLHSDQALYIAEAGMQRAVATLNNDTTWRGGFTEESLGDGVYSVSVMDSSSNPALGDTIFMQASGQLDGGDAVSNIQVWVVHAPAHPFQYSLFGDASTEVETSCTDSYNSDSGSYAATQSNQGGDVGSNGFVNVHSGSTIGGSITTATPGGISVSAGSTVSGDTSTTAAPQTLNAVTDSEFVWAQGVSSAPAGMSGNFSYNPGTKALTYDSLVLTSGVYYFSSVFADSLGSLTLAPGANVTIYVIGDFEIEHNSSVNAGGNPADFAIYSQGGEFEIEHNSVFYGTFYGPLSEAEIEHDSQVFGSIVANEIEMEDNSCFHFDRNLLNVSKGVGEGYQVAWWREL